MAAECPQFPNYRRVSLLGCITGRCEKFNINPMRNIGSSAGLTFIISMKGQVGVRIDDADAIQSFFLPVLRLRWAYADGGSSVSG
jgi:hypothetical protein